MNRRDALLTTGSMVFSASLGALACGGTHAVAQNSPKTPPAPPSGSHAGHGIPANPALHEAAQGCIAKGDVCIAHCIALLASGDATMAGCLKTARDMHAVMHGLAAAAASGNRNLAALAKVALEFCKDCEAECRKHESHHASCKDCADACAKTIAACQKVAAT